MYNFWAYLSWIFKAQPEVQLVRSNQQAYIIRHYHLYYYKFPQRVKGYLSMQSNQGLFLGGFLTLRMDFQTKLLHLNPEPKANCQILSPLLTFSFASK